jgi:hypothetical protein
VASFHSACIEQGECEMPGPSLPELTNNLEAKYEFLERQKSGTKASFTPSQKAGVAEAFKIAILDDD